MVRLLTLLKLMVLFLNLTTWLPEGPDGDLVALSSRPLLKGLLDLSLNLWDSYNNIWNLTMKKQVTYDFVIFYSSNYKISYFYLLPLNSVHSSPSSVESSFSSQQRRMFSLFCPSWWQASQPQANLNKFSKNCWMILWSVKLTFKKDEKLLLIQRAVFLWDMVAISSSLSPSSNSLIEFSICGDLGKSLPGLK